jgi:hypothetical protein
MRITNVDPEIRIRKREINADPGRRLIEQTKFLFEGTFTSFFTDKKSIRSYKAVGIKVFLYTIFAW